MPPKAWNCRYDCGFGCEKASDDEGGGADSDEATAIGDEEENMASEAETQDEGEEVGDADSSQMSRSDLDAAAWTQGSDASMVVEPGEHSPAISTSGSIRSASPNPGVAYWVAHMRYAAASPVPRNYHFLQTPLRLSPQLEHCRGDPMVLGCRP